MKKVLLGTTALVAAGAFAAGAAQADEMMNEPVTVGLSGYTTGSIGFASDSSDSQRGHEIGYVYEFNVSGSTTLDNGITVAVSAQLGTTGQYNRNSAGDPLNDQPFDEIHTTLSGSFGSIRLGRTESAAFNTTTAAPGAGIGGMFGINYSWFSTAVPTINTYSGLGTEDALKVVYTSPNFNGLSIGVSYAPEDSDEQPATGRMIGDGLGGHTAVGVTYSTDFMEGGSLSLGAAYETADMEAGGADPEATRFGMNVGIDQLSFGGSMYDVDGGAMVFDVGASWTEGATELGVQYGHNDGTDVGSTFAHLTYTLGPGVLVGAQIGGSDDVTQFMLGTAVFF